MNFRSLQFLLLMAVISAESAYAAPDLTQYDVVWTSPSADASESMPVGGHSIGANVWVENGDLLLYVQRSGAFTEHNEYHKLGRLRLRFEPNPFIGESDFRQTLKLREGYIEIIGEYQDVSVRIDVWVEALRPILHVDIDSSEAILVDVAYENWRQKPLELTSESHGMRFGCFSWDSFPGQIVRYTDQVKHENDSVVFVHRNRDDCLLFDFMIEQQGLQDYRERLVNTQKGRTFGGVLDGEGLTTAGTSEGLYGRADYVAWHLSSEQPRRRHAIRLVTHIDQTDSLDDWEQALQALADDTSLTKHEAREQTRAWWSAFWDRSWLMINPNVPAPQSEAWQVGRNYQLFRYQMGCNVYGEYPTKFNGGNFTFDPHLVLQEGNRRDFMKPGPTPDWRAWGGGSFTAQNQRLLYWPMLKTGDYDVMLPQFEFYRRALPAAISRVESYWGHAGCAFTEQIEDFGLPIACAWGWSEPQAINRRRPTDFEHGAQVNSALKYHFQSQLEFSYMILEYQRYTDADISEYIQLIDQSVRFFDEHYQMRHYNRTGKPLDEEGKLVIYPSTVCESYKDAKNPVDVISGLRACLGGLLALPQKYASDLDLAYYQAFLQRVPDYPYGEIEDEAVMRPAESWSSSIKAEAPQFYPLFPYNQFVMGRDDLSVFHATWRLDQSYVKNNEWSWHQDGIFLARMGLLNEAVAYNVSKMRDSPRRFPTFWGPGHDWVPDHNWGGSGMLGIQEMLLQTVGNQLLLFPCWPKEWDVDFKLHAPGNTTVEGRLRGGVLEHLVVVPQDRLDDVVIMNDIPHANPSIFP